MGKAVGDRYEAPDLTGWRHLASGVSEGGLRMPGGDGLSARRSTPGVGQLEPGPGQAVTACPSHRAQQGRKEGGLPAPARGPRGAQVPPGSLQAQPGACMEPGPAVL